MTIDPNEATTSLQDIATVERRTREAMFYGGSSAIFIMWGVLVACGYGLTELYPRPGIIWLGVSAAGCAATALIIALRMHARPSESRDWRVIWAMLALSIFGTAWSFLLGPVVPRHMMYAFQPSLFLLGVIRVFPQLLFNDRHRALERRFIAGESAEHVVADLKIETLLRKARRGDADGGHDRDREKLCHRRPPVGRPLWAGAPALTRLLCVTELSG